jgi:hypothetical protein
MVITSSRSVKTVDPNEPIITISSRQSRKSGACRSHSARIANDHFEVSRFVAGRRGDDDRHPCFLTEREAISYMRDRLDRLAVFER